jgi:fructosamine-3-kinase
VNTPKQDFITFFIENRLQPQLEMAVRKHSRMQELLPFFERLFQRLPEIIPAEKPALLHGDLWSGNFLVGPEGRACIIDPAVYYGHRESDLAMSKLFGGFDEDFYGAYNAAFPLAPGWKERTDIFNLYPLLVHVNLFGGGYIQQAAAVVRPFS